MTVKSSGFSCDPLPFATLSETLSHWSRVAPDALALTCGREELTWAQFEWRGAELGLAQAEFSAEIEWWSSDTIRSRG